MLTLRMVLFLLKSHFKDGSSSLRGVLLKRRQDLSSSIQDLSSTVSLKKALPLRSLVYIFLFHALLTGPKVYHYLLPPLPIVQWLGLITHHAKYSTCSCVSSVTLFMLFCTTLPYHLTPLIVIIHLLLFFFNCLCMF